MAKPFCSLPWTGVHINQQLDVFFCCLMANPENTLGNLREQSLTDILNSEAAREVRQGFLDGVVPSRCKSACGFRTGDIINDLNVPEKQMIFGMQQLDHITLHAADIRSSNLCTLDCVYCGPLWSSTIAKRDGHNTLIPNAENQRQYQQYINDIDLSDIRRLFLAGGEPLLMKEYIDLLSRVIQQRPDCEITVNTGLSVINTPVFALLKQLKNVTWIVSVDNTNPDKFAYIRHGNTWDNFVNNLSIIRSIPGHNIYAHMVYFSLSYKDFDRSYNALKDLNVDHILIDPVAHDALDIRNVPHIINEVQQNIEQYYTDGIFDSQVYNTIKGKLSTPHQCNQTIEQFLAQQDQKYNMDSKQIFPELYNG